MIPTYQHNVYYDGHGELAKESGIIRNQEIIMKHEGKLHDFFYYAIDAEK